MLLTHEHKQMEAQTIEIAESYVYMTSKADKYILC